MKILLTESDALISNGDISLDIFKNFGDYVEYKNICRAELIKEAVDSDVILCNKVSIDREVFECAKKLKYIGLCATGYNNVDIDCAREKGVTVCNAAGYSTNAVTQQVIGYILMHYTKIPEYSGFVRRGGWKEAEIFAPLVYSTEEVYGKTLGIIGYGSIGKAVEKAALGLGMKVIVYTRTVRENGVTEFVSFEELLERSDIVTVHCPLNSRSAGMMNEKAFSKMKEGAFFINTSRGGVVVEEDLYRALRSGRLSGAAVDVLTEEPMSANCILAEAPNIIITPHTAWAPLSARKRLIKLVAQSLSAFLDGQEVNNLAE